MAVHVESARGIEETDRVFLISQIQDAVERATTIRPVVDDPPPGGCASPDRCIGDIKTRTNADVVLFVRLIGAPSRLRIGAERTPAAEGSAGNTTIDLTRDRSTWGPPIDGLAVSLFPDAATFRTPPPPPPAVAATPPTQDVVTSPAIDDEGGDLTVAGWAMVGVGLVVAGVATGLGVLSQNARDEHETDVMNNVMRSTSEVDDLEAQAQGLGWGANVGWGVGGAAVATGIILLVVN